MDYLVLGCTHYPYLTSLISEILPENICILDSAEAVAKQTKRILSQNNLLAKGEVSPTHLWLTNKQVEILKSFAPPQVKVQYEKFWVMNFEFFATQNLKLKTQNSKLKT